MSQIIRGAAKRTAIEGSQIWAVCSIANGKAYVFLADYFPRGIFEDRQCGIESVTH